MRSGGSPPWGTLEASGATLDPVLTWADHGGLPGSARGLYAAVPRGAHLFTVRGKGDGLNFKPKLIGSHRLMLVEIPQAHRPVHASTG